MDNPKDLDQDLFSLLSQNISPQKGADKKNKKRIKKRVASLVTLMKNCICIFFYLDDNSRMLLPIHIQMQSHPLQLLQSGKKAPGWESHLLQPEVKFVTTGSHVIFCQMCIFF